MTNKYYPNGSGSVVAIAGHPLPPMFVPVPIGALLGGLIFDIAFVTTGNQSWAAAAYYFLLTGLITGGIAALVGAIELGGLQRARSLGLAWAHGGLDVIALAITFINVVLRHSGPEAVSNAGLAMSAIVVALLALSAVLGGEMVFKHGIGVTEVIGSHNDRHPDLTPSGGSDIGKG
jgi:uncharacterized membrane protein